MQSKRITHNIKADVKKMEKLLNSIREDRRVYIEFMRNPRKVLERFDLPVARYAREKLPQAMLIEDLSKSVQIAVENEFVNAIRGTLVAETSYRKDSSSSYEYNFDNSSSTDYKYESHTGTERGTFSETSRGEATDSNRGFNDVQINNLEAVLLGPLISEVAMKSILVNVEKTLNLASQATVTG